MIPPADHLTLTKVLLIGEHLTDGAITHGTSAVSRRSSFATAIAGVFSAGFVIAIRLESTGLIVPAFSDIFPRYRHIKAVSSSMSVAKLGTTKILAFS